MQILGSAGHSDRGMERDMPLSSSHRCSRLPIRRPVFRLLRSVRMWRRSIDLLSGATISVMVIATALVPAHAQSPAETPIAGIPANEKPALITLDEAIKRAEANEPAYAAQ